MKKVEKMQSSESKKVFNEEKLINELLISIIATKKAFRDENKEIPKFILDALNKTTGAIDEYFQNM